MVSLLSEKERELMLKNQEGNCIERELMSNNQEGNCIDKGSKA